MFLGIHSTSPVRTTRGPRAFRIILVIPLFWALLGLCMLWPSSLHAGAASFITPEYGKSTGLASMNAAEAYALGFTGKNVTVSVLEEFFCSPREEFADKYPYGYIADKQRFKDNGDVSDPPHGVHVAGIIAAAKNDRGMHGIAFDATLLPLNAYYTIPKELLMEAKALRIGPLGIFAKSLGVLQDFPDVRINNQSLGIAMFVDERAQDIYRNKWGEDVLKQFAESNSTQEFVRSAGKLGNMGNLMVWSAGNEGQFGPSVLAAMPSVLAMTGEDASAFERNWLAIAASTPRFAPNDPRFISPFTNLGQNASSYTLFAPGTDIYSTARPDAWGFESGTSMAAPYAAGAAALVQQAFPYMEGRQLADVLLSTATPMDKPGAFPEFCIVKQDTGAVARLLQKDGKYEFVTSELGKPKGDVTPESYETIVLTYQGSSFNGKLTAKLRADFDTLLELEGDEDELDDILGNVRYFSLEAYRELFGQGAINVGKAVRGPGFFDAARLRENDLSVNEFGNGKSYAMYAVDTQGFDSVWSNDIGERRTKEGPLALLGVGLRKDGAGVLHITGKNSYTGPTEVRGGVISLGMAGQKRQAVIAGDVAVRSRGTFSGAGLIRGKLVNDGLVSPGYTGRTDSTLTIGGSLSGNGRLRFTLASGGKMNRIAAAKADLRGTRFELASSPESPVTPYTDYLDAISTPVAVSGLSTERLAYSAFIGFIPEAGANGGVSLRADTRALNSLPGVPGKTQAAAGALQHLYDSFRGSARQEQLNALYRMDRRSFLDTAASMRGDIAAATLINLPFNGLMGRMLRDNPAPVAAVEAQAPSDDAPADDAPADFATASGKGSAAAQPISIWLTPMAGYSKTKADSDIRQQSFHTHSRGFALGAQKNFGKAYIGAMFALGDGTIRSNHDKAEIVDVRVGLYGGWQPGAFCLRALITGGKQYYDTDRYVNTGRRREHFSSNYRGHSFGLGLQTSYNILQNFTDKAALSPYLGYELEYIRQNSRRENGNSLYALDVKDKHVWRGTLEPGLALDLTPVNWLTLSASAGYKRLLNGHRPELDVGFRADRSYRFTAISPNEARDYFTYSLKAEASLPHNVKLSARFHSDTSGKTQNYDGSVNFIFAW